MLIKNFNYSEKEISMLLRDIADEYLWVGFNQDASGNCALQKVSFNNPLQVYYDIDIAVTEIKAGACSGSYLYLALSDSSLIGRRYNRSTPLSTTVDFDLPVGISEAPIDVVVDTYVNFLIPGIVSGTNAKIIQYTTSGTFVQTIDLTTVNNASSFCKSGDDFWVVTNEDPSKYVRVYPLSGGGYSFTENY